MTELLFTSAGRICLIRADGAGLRLLDVDIPDQVTWQPGGFLPDGRLLLLSMEARRDGPGRPFDLYYTQTPTHIWAYDLDGGGLEELATRERLAPFITPQLVLRDGRILVQVCRPGASPGAGQVFSMNLDGTDARAFTSPGEGLPYGFSLSPDGRRVAFHLASPAGYQIWTGDIRGGDRICVAADPDHFNRIYQPELARGGAEICRLAPHTGAMAALTSRGPNVWDFRCCASPDGRLIAFCRAETGELPGLWVMKADGSDPRLLTRGLRDQGADHPRWVP